MIKIDPFAGISDLLMGISLIKGSFLLTSQVHVALAKLIPVFGYPSLELETTGNQ